MVRDEVERRAGCLPSRRDGPRHRPVLGPRPVRTAARGRGAPRRQRTTSTIRDELIDGPTRDAEQMEADLRGLIATVQNPHLRRLLARVFGEGSRDLGQLPRRAGGQALPPGLPPRAARALPDASPRPSARSRPPSRASTATSRSPARCCTTSASSRPTSVHGERDLDVRPAAGCTARSRSATTACGALIERLDGFPAELEQALLHIILSHHGSLEHGSPVVPCTREATLVHMIDNLGGRLGSFDRLEKELPRRRAVVGATTRGSAAGRTSRGLRSPSARRRSRSRGSGCRRGRAPRRRDHARVTSRNSRAKSAQIAHRHSSVRHGPARPNYS